jgi:hypothetical protein
VKINRPNFFPGQLIDYKDFNRLATQPEKILSFLCHHLFVGGGVVIGASTEFEVVPVEGLRVRICPGVGVLPAGGVVVIEADLLVDLASLANSPDTKEVIVSIRNRVRGVDRYTDSEDSTIAGYKTEAFEPETIISTGKSPAEAIEIFRVRLNETVTALKRPSIEEEWQNELSLGVIDTRFRRLIVPQTYSPLSGAELLELRQSLYAVERAHGKLQKIYLVDDPFTTLLYLSQLHAELLSRPLQPLKGAFLICEFAEKLSLYLDRLVKQTGQERSNLDKETFVATITLLEEMRVREVTAGKLPVDSLIKLGHLMKTLVDYAERKFSLLNTVEEALIDIRDRAFEFDNHIILAGHLFERVDWLTAESERYDVKASGSLVRLLSTRYRNGDEASLRGRFLKEGQLTLRLQIPRNDRPLVILLHQYVRRAGSQLHYEINGKHLTTEECEYSDLSNNWMNRGLVVPQDLLVPNENLLSIRIERSDLDFGFFDVAVYQPSRLREVVTRQRTTLAGGELR